MTNPKHPAKVLIMIKGGMLTGIFMDRDIGNVKFLIADYDVQGDDSPELGVDISGDERYLYEHAAWIDTPMVRGVINKKGNKKQEDMDR